jgi:hypothetical protein
MRSNADVLTYADVCRRHGEGARFCRFELCQRVEGRQLESPGAVLLALLVQRYKV